MTHNRSQKKLLASHLLLATTLLMMMATQIAEAGQGCPFDDGSCQEYCGQQGCNMGYCGHFAWIQCICRKCGDEWSWYDKVRYNPDKTVNQTELDSLKLNGTSTLILTSGQDGPQQQPSTQTSAKVNGRKAQVEANKQQTATLTTLLIPDLSDTSGKLDLNDIPDENSDKFLDYLAKNHEKLVQATATAKAEGDQEMEDDYEEQVQSRPISTTSSQEERDDEMVEIQISSSNNNTSNEHMTTTSSPPPKPTTEQQLVSSSSTSTTTTTTSSSPTRPEANAQQQHKSPITRLLRMAVVERASEEID